MKEPNPDHVRKICELIDISPFPLLLSIRCLDIGIGFARIGLDIDHKHTQLAAVVHGGVYATLIDTAAFWSVYYGIEDPNLWLVSVDLKVNFLAPAHTGKLIAVGREIRTGKKLGYAEAVIENEDGKIYAHGTSTVMIVPGDVIGEHIGNIPKFVNNTKNQGG
jgi:uncharacterized protein (TIGR00369 family)